MKYGDVSHKEYCNGVDALKWTLLEKKNTVRYLEERLEYARKEVQDVENDLKDILNVEPER